MDAARLNLILGEFREGLERIYGDRLIGMVLFGSQARKDARFDSDIDVLVVLRGPAKPTGETERISTFRAELCLKYDVVISCIFVSEEDYAKRESPLLINVAREGILV